MHLTTAVFLQLEESLKQLNLRVVSKGLDLTGKYRQSQGGITAEEFDYA